GASAETIADMTACGLHVGRAFQMSDDLLDVSGRPSVTGKPLGTDLRDGNPSLPIVLALGRDPELARLFAKPSLEPAEVDHALDRIQQRGLIPEIAAMAARHARAAIEAIERLPASPARTALETLARTLVQRTA